MPPRPTQNQLIVIGLAAAASMSLLLWYLTKGSPEKSVDSKQSKKAPASESSNSRSIPETPPKKDRSVKTAAEEKTPLVKNTNLAEKEDDKDLHARIEELDKKGKVLFKNKQVS